VLLELDGTRVLTDPVLRRHVGPLVRRSPRPHAGLLTDLDAILISHLHLDHYDPPSLRRLDRGTPVVGPKGSGRSLARLGFADVRELSPGEETAIGALRVVATAAVHEKGRHPLNRATDCVGFVVAGGLSAYFAGDTALFPGMEGLWPDLDVALLPVAGWGLTLPEGEHMGPQQAARALRLLRPRLAVPVHWGTFGLPGTGLGRRGRDAAAAAPAAFRRHARELAPEVSVSLMRPGETLRLAEALAGRDRQT
jgi:L-ascorbate metabolism protein UlaG (beta-lactamase superfamily)